MNFIGHATVALWQRAEPAFVLGSMLPDFAGMAGARLSASRPAPLDTSEETLAAGVALHHRTDDVFHATPVFVGLLQETLDELSALGIARGTARAVGHVGVEMLIDGELVQTPEVALAYTRALRETNVPARFFVDASHAARWELLRQRLIVYGAPYDYRDPASVLTRLQAVLRGRPRLAIDSTALPVLRAALPGLQRKVVARLSALLDTLRAQLS